MKSSVWYGLYLLVAMYEFEFLGGLSVGVEVVSVSEQFVVGAQWWQGKVVMSIGGRLVVLAA